MIPTIATRTSTLLPLAVITVIITSESSQDAAASFSSSIECVQQAAAHSSTTSNNRINNHHYHQRSSASSRRSILRSLKSSSSCLKIVVGLLAIFVASLLFLVGSMFYNVSIQIQQRFHQSSGCNHGNIINTTSGMSTTEENPSHHLSTEFTNANLPATAAAGIGGVVLVILLHMSGNADKEIAIQETWLSRLPQSVAVMKFGSKYSGGTGSSFLKTQNAFGRALKLYPTAQYFAKFDDDSFVYVSNLLRKLLISGTESLYAGFASTCCDQEVKYGSGGAGYILARMAATKLQSCDSNMSPFEDFGVGLCLMQLGVHLTDLVGLHPSSPKQMLDWDRNGHLPENARGRETIEGYELPISYHYINPISMRQMHKDPRFVCQWLRNSIFKDCLNRKSNLRLCCDC
jgi:hypothetical protein